MQYEQHFPTLWKLVSREETYNLVLAWSPNIKNQICSFFSNRVLSSVSYEQPVLFWGTLISLLLTHKAISHLQHSLMTFGFWRQHYPLMQGTSLKTLSTLFLIHLPNSRTFMIFQSLQTLSLTSSFSSASTGEKAMKEENLLLVREQFCCSFYSHYWNQCEGF